MRHEAVALVLVGDMERTAAHLAVCAARNRNSAMACDMETIAAHAQRMRLRAARSPRSDRAMDADGL